ncbi:hypothetical protein Kintu_gp66 [Xanthomonas phage Kintu]
MTPVERCHLFVADNLSTIAREQLELEETGILCAGKYREAQKFLESELSIDGGTSMSVVKSILLTELIKFKLSN